MSPKTLFLDAYCSKVLEFLVSPTAIIFVKLCNLKNCYFAQFRYYFARIGSNNPQIRAQQVRIYTKTPTFSGRVIFFYFFEFGGSIESLSCLLASPPDGAVRVYALPITALGEVIHCFCNATFVQALTGAYRTSAYHTSAYRIFFFKNLFLVSLHPRYDTK